MLSRFEAVKGWIGLVVRLVLAGIFAWAGAAKLGDPRSFTRAVRAYDATPEWLSKAIGYGLPVLEVALAVLLVLGVITRYAAAIVGVLLIVFMIGIIQAGARDIKLECGCFGGGGTSTSTSYTLDILRDLGLLVLVAYLVLWPLTKWSVDQAIINSEIPAGLSTKQRRSEKNVKRYRAAVAAAEVELKHKQRFIAAGTAATLVLVTLIAIGVQSGRAKISTTADSTNASTTTGVRVGNQAAPVTVDLYEDFQCPVCNNLEQTLGTDLAAKIKATSVKVNYHVMSFLDSSSNGNRYSSRAANAGYCVSDTSADDFLKFHAILYGKTSAGAYNQPSEGTNGRTDSQLIAYAKQAGVASATLNSCVTDESHKSLVQGVTEAASKKGVNGTPTVYVDGKVVSGSGGNAVTTAQIDAAIAKALSTAKSTAAPSPTPTVTGTGTAATSAVPAATATATASTSKTASASATASATASPSG